MAITRVCKTSKLNFEINRFSTQTNFIVLKLDKITENNISGHTHTYYYTYYYWRSGKVWAAIISALRLMRIIEYTKRHLILLITELEAVLKEDVKDTFRSISINEV